MTRVAQEQKWRVHGATQMGSKRQTEGYKKWPTERLGRVGQPFATVEPGAPHTGAPPAGGAACGYV